MNALRTFYDYLKEIPDLDKFNRIPIPKTQHQEDLKHSNKSAVEHWLESFTLINYYKDEIELSGSEILTEFNRWKSENNITYETNSIKLGMTLKKINGVEKGKHTMFGKTKIFNIQKLKSVFNITDICESKNENIEYLED